MRESFVSLWESGTDFQAVIMKYANSSIRNAEKSGYVKRDQQDALTFIHAVAITTDVLLCVMVRPRAADVSYSWWRSLFKVRRWGRCSDVASARLCPTLQIEVGYLWTDKAPKGHSHLSARQGGGRAAPAHNSFIFQMESSAFYDFVKAKYFYAKIIYH